MKPILVPVQMNIKAPLFLKTTKKKKTQGMPLSLFFFFPAPLVPCCHLLAKVSIVHIPKSPAVVVFFCFDRFRMSI